MLIAILLLAGGAGMLAVGAGMAIRGAVRISEAHGVPAFVLGALLFGIDPESLGATLFAAGGGQTTIAAAIGSGLIAFVLAAFGLALLLSPRPVQAPSHEMTLLPCGALVLGALMVSDRVVSRVEGAALVAAYVLYIALVVGEGRSVQVRGEEIRREAREGMRAVPPLPLLLAGLVLVYVGADLLVDGGVRLLVRTTLAAGFVGAAIVGALASLDEVLLEVLPIRRGAPDLATGNLLGTVAAFTTGVPGLAALVRPLVLDGAGAVAFVSATSLYAVVAVVFLTRGRAGRATGALLVAAYGAWLVLSSRL